MTDKRAKRLPTLTEDERIRRQYRAMRRTWTKEGLDRTEDFGSFFWPELARIWKRPVQEIKRICRPTMYREDGTEL